MSQRSLFLVRALCAAALCAGFVYAALPAGAKVEEGRAAFTDYRHEQPGTVRKITIADLPQPYATRAVDNGAHLVARPANAWPQALPGFTVTEYATGLTNPRLVRTAPNGDLFVVESEPGRIRVLRGIDAHGHAEKMEVYATGLTQPFGLAFYPPGPNPTYLYVGNTNSVVRFPYHNGDMKASGKPETLVKIPGGGRLRGGGHWTRDLAFSKDGAKLFISVGSHSNDDDTDNNPAEYHRADILAAKPDGSGLEVYAWGIRNAVGIAVQPQTGELWASVNERDNLGDNLVPDYITHIVPGGFYGWPWFYMGGHWDPRQQGKHPELKSKVLTPDVLLQPHNASLEMTFYEGTQFPAEYRGDIFAAEHGSWNKAVRTGYEVIRVPLEKGRATGEYEDFLTGFVTPSGDVWGRPVGVAVAKDGSLIVADDGSNTVWHVAYGGR
ncbi:MAG TPA: sorbosone dehydrogenase family protein [Bryobacteraceae bacterium]|jgi:glucose/arabinose dehydrogenase